MKTRQGTNFGLILLLAPAIALVWAFVSPTILPHAQWDFFKFATAVASASYVLVWLLTFYRTQRDGTLVAISFFLYLWWWIGCLLGLAKWNVTMDQSPTRIETVKAMRSTAVGGGAKSRPYCLVWMTQELHGLQTISLKVNACEGLEPFKDMIHLRFREGALGRPWLEGYEIENH